MTRVVSHVSFKRLVRGREFQQAIDQLCSKEHRIGKVYFSAEKHYEWKQIQFKRSTVLSFFSCWQVAMQ